MPEKERKKGIIWKLQSDTIRYDCRFYTGYKPCGKAEFCMDCEEYEPVRTKILIIKLAALGDVLRTTSILPGLKKRFPQSHITWATRENAVPLLENNPLIDSLHVMNAEGILTVAGKEYDLAINFEKEDSALSLFKKINAAEKRGFEFSSSNTLSVANNGSLYALQLGLSDELKFHLNKKTYPEIIYEMAEIPYEGEEYVLELSGRSRHFRDEILKRSGINPDKLKIGLNTGCGGVFQTKRWTVRGFAELTDILNREHSVEILLLGGPRETEFNRRIIEEVETSIHDMGCNNHLEDFLGIMDLCDVVVSSDSLAAHIAIALKKDLVVFFGPTCPQEVDLFDRGGKIVMDCVCAPCYRKYCDKEKSCLENMPASRVYEEIMRIMEKIRSRIE